MCTHATDSRLPVTVVAILLWTGALVFTPDAALAVDAFEGRFYSGQGDVEYLRLLDFSRRMFSPDPGVQNIAMLYTPAWNGFVEGPTWTAWWIQNSYGTTYSTPWFERPPP